MNSKKKITVLIKLAMVTALYVAVSMLLMPLSFGAVQIRIAEMFNLLIIYDKRYMYAITLGCAITNFFSPLGMLDVVIGAGSTFIALWLSEKGLKWFKALWKKLVWIDVIVTLSTITVALELHFLSQLPLVATAVSVMIGEALSLAIGTIVLLILHRHFKSAYYLFDLS